MRVDEKLYCTRFALVTAPTTGRRGYQGARDYLPDHQ
jgi:hypothetical protein